MLYSGSGLCWIPNLNIAPTHFPRIHSHSVASIIGEQAAALAVKSTPHIMWWGLSMMAIQVVWLVVGLTATIVPLAYGVPFRGSDGATSQTSFPASIWYILLACFWILSVAWQFIVVEKVVAATVASSAASWCSSPGDVEPVWVTFRRVLNSSLG